LACGWGVLIFLGEEKFNISFSWVGKVKALYAFDAGRVGLCEKAECAFTCAVAFLF
jgi:hypothetical protein